MSIVVNEKVEPKIFFRLNMLMKMQIFGTCQTNTFQ